MSTTLTMTFEEFKANCIFQVGERHVRFSEHGKHGWSSVDDILDGDFTGKPGSHWCDARRVNPSSQWLIGTYDFNSGVASFFSRE